eukprot:m.23933 g.23933  ORF g.23933 m.23933 type:complete len:1186 (+) comp7556_c0_seq2:349-3906(+)
MGSKSKERVVYCYPRRTGALSSENPNYKGRYTHNRVSSCRYTAYTFLPKNLFEQFQRAANFYFLCMMAIALVPGLSPITPITSVLPLVFVVSVTMAKQGWEDYVRHLADKAVNSKPTKVISYGGNMLEILTKQVEVGDIVHVKPNQEFPCDLALLRCMNDEGECYITTANVDGETSLKIRTAPENTQSIEPHDLIKRGITVKCGPPDAELYSFNGVVSVPNDGHKHENGKLNGTHEPSDYPISSSQLLLKGSVLKGHSDIYGVAVYTGKETKIALNLRPVPTKTSSAERRLNGFLIVMLSIMILVCCMSSILKFYLEVYALKFWPLEFPIAEYDRKRDGWLLFLEWRAWDFLQFLILYSNLIPISLYVTLELQKLFGALLIMWDVDLYDEDLDEPIQSRCSDINEELGQVEHLFCDKTGTLTQNIMVFRKCSVNGHLFSVVGQKTLELRESPHKSNTLPQMDESQLKKATQEFFLCACLCSTVHVTKRKNKGTQSAGESVVDDDTHSVAAWDYTAESPDEEALVKAAAELRNVDIRLSGSGRSSMEVIVEGNLQSFKKIHVCAFNSNRMRMSVLVKNSNDETVLYVKGADSSMFPRMHNLSDVVNSISHTHLSSFSRAGLRTLVMGRRVLGKQEAEKVIKDLTEASKLIDKRAETLDKIYDAIERDFEYLGLSAVEDTLQENVKETMETLREAGCKVWVLTGDKAETAIDISLSVGHFTCDMKRLEALDITDSIEAENTLRDFLESVLSDKLALSDRSQMSMNAIAKQNSNDSDSLKHSPVNVTKFGRKTPAPDWQSGRYGHALILSGKTVKTALEKCPNVLRELCCECSAVLGCRLSPMQKALIIRLIKTPPRKKICAMLRPPRHKPITLAIGDGANDVTMIREADVGIGIFGKEGRQAARASDFALGKFCFLKKLLLVHGHYCYNRTSYTIQYFFYKNFVMMLPVILYGAASLYSSEPLYDSWLLMCWNMVFTAGPVLFFGMFEIDLDAEALITYPTVHKSLMGNKSLLYKSFFGWIGLSIVHALIVLAASIYAFSSTAIPSGINIGIRLFGTLIYTATFLVVTAKICVDTRHWTWVTHFGVWFCSLASYIFFILLYTGLDNVFGSYTTQGVYWVGFEMFSDYHTVSILAFILLGIIFMELFRAYVYRTFFPTEVQRVQNHLWKTKPSGKKQAESQPLLGEDA